MKAYEFLENMLIAVYPVMILDVIVLLVNSFILYRSENQIYFLNSCLMDAIIIAIAAALVVRKFNTIRSVIIVITFLALLWQPLLAVSGCIALQSYGLLQNIESIPNFTVGVLFSSVASLPLNLIIGFIVSYIFLKLSKRSPHKMRD